MLLPCLAPNPSLVIDNVLSPFLPSSLPPSLLPFLLSFLPSSLLSPSLSPFFPLSLSIPLSLSLNRCGGFSEGLQGSEALGHSKASRWKESEYLNNCVVHNVSSKKH